MLLASDHIYDLARGEKLRLYARPPRPEVAQNGDQQLLEMVEEGQPDQINLSAGKPVHLSGELANRPLDALRGCIQSVRGISGHQARGTALEQRQADVILESSNAPVDRGLADPSGARGAAGRSLPIEREEHADIVPREHRRQLFTSAYPLASISIEQRLIEA
jgi:hypothetical protein